MRRPRGGGLLHRTHIIVLAVLGILALLVAWVACSGPAPRDTGAIDVPAQSSPAVRARSE